MEKLFTECFVCGKTGKIAVIGAPARMEECRKCLGTGVILTEHGKQTVLLMDLLQKKPKVREQV